MRKISISLLFAVVLAMTVAATALPALGAATVEKYTQEGGELASVVYLVNRDCIFAQVQVAGGNFMGLEAYNSTIFFDYYNQCTDEYMYGIGDGLKSDFLFFLQGSTARLKGNIQISKYINGEYVPGTATVDLQLHARNDAKRSKNIIRFQSPTEMNILYSAGFTSTATTSGTIVIDGIPIVGADDTPVESLIQTQSTGSRTVIRPPTVNRRAKMTHF